MSLVEIGRFARNEAYILVGRLDSEGIPAVAFDGHASIVDGSAFFIPVRVMVDADDAAAARAIIAAAARFLGSRSQLHKNLPAIRL